MNVVLKKVIILFCMIFIILSSCSFVLGALEEPQLVSKSAILQDNKTR